MAHDGPPVAAGPLARAGRVLADAFFLLGHAGAVTVAVLRLAARYLWLWLRVRLSHRPLDPPRWRTVHVGAAEVFVRAAVRHKGGLIKLGQIWSARADILPPESIAILERLQDQVEPAPFAQVRDALARELGPALAELRELEPGCLAAASFGQVHRARLADGTAVAVKVQHRRIERTLAIDLRILRAGFWLFDRLVPRLGLLRVFGEIAEAMWRELDYRAEAAHCRRVAAIFADDPRVVIPTPIERLSTGRVLTLTLIDGIKVTDVARLRAAGIDPVALMRLIVEAYSRQMYLAGFFQSDPHPGNLFGLPGPRLGIVDFGMAKEIPEQLLSGLRRAVYAVLVRDMDGLLAALVVLGVVGARDRERLRPLLLELAARIRSGSSQEVAALQRELGANAGELFGQLRRLLAQLEELRVPEDLVLYGRALSLLQGLMATLAPDFDLFGFMLPWMLRFVGADVRPLPDDAARPLRPGRSTRRAPRPG